MRRLNSWKDQQRIQKRECISIFIQMCVRNDAIRRNNKNINTLTHAHNWPNQKENSSVWFGQCILLNPKRVHVKELLQDMHSYTLTHTKNL